MHFSPVSRWSSVVVGATLLAATLDAQPSPTKGVTSGVRPSRYAIRNATVVDGSGAPARGPVDIVIEGGRITDIQPIDPVAMRAGRARRPAADAEIDATGKFVLPGLVNAHAHIQSNRSGQSMGGFDYYYKLQLAAGITTVREVGAENEKQSVEMRDKSARGEIVAPRIYVYPFFDYGGRIKTAADARLRVQEMKKLGVDGIKIGGIERDLMAAMEDEAKKLGLPIAHHVGVEETNVWDDIKYGTRSIEHWYGVPDAAILDLRQNFPSDYNYLDETDRFRWAGRLWREAEPKLLDSVLTSMVRANVTWVPTLVIYEASRDLQRAQTQPWFKDYLHPSLENYFKPDPANHGSYFIGWSSTDEVYWKENYRIWMSALRDYERKGGVIACGEDAGFIYEMYGFALIRELELHAEAGFHPLKVIQHCTLNGARVLGAEDKIGRVRAGWAADLIVVDGNPLEDLKVLYPGGTGAIRDGKESRTLGVEWTIKDGIPYHGPTLLKDVKEIVAKARGSR
jgi:cytosine/adenosine deaminase-related metal-dependent hydrolase